MKIRNVILLTLSVAIVSGFAGWTAGEEPAVYQVRNLQPQAGDQVIEFVRMDAAETSPIEPATSTAPALVSQKIRICTNYGVPVPNVLVEWFQLFGDVFVLKDTCTTDNDGRCSVEGEPEANGKIQVTQQFSAPIRFAKLSQTVDLPPCQSPAAPPQ